MLEIIIRPEERADVPAIRAVIVAAFEDQSYNNHREQHIVDKLREKVARSRFHWCLCLMSVTPIHQRKGIGSRLINAGLKLLEAGGANGCVLLGESDFSSRFGFVARQGLSLDGFPTEYFLARPFSSECQEGKVLYHDAFTA